MAEKESMSPMDEAFFKELEEAGERLVRANLARKRYAENKQGLVHEWLRQNDQARTEAGAERDESFKREEIEIARDAAFSASNSAEEANRIARDAASSARASAAEAKEANLLASRASMTAKIAIAISAITIIVTIIGSIIGLFVSA